MRLDLPKLYKLASMVRREFTRGFDGYKSCLEKFSKDKKSPLYILFTGDKDEQGQSWCPDCNVAQPFIEQAVEKFAGSEDIFLTVEVGDRPFWKDMKNPFRVEANIKLMVIPTLIRWRSVARLEGEQCAKIDLLDMFFNED